MFSLVLALGRRIYQGEKIIKDSIERLDLAELADNIRRAKVCLLSTIIPIHRSLVDVGVISNEAAELVFKALNLPIKLVKLS